MLSKKTRVYPWMFCSKNKHLPSQTLNWDHKSSLPSRCIKRKPRTGQDLTTWRFVTLKNWSTSQTITLNSEQVETTRVEQEINCYALTAGTRITSSHRVRTNITHSQPSGRATDALIETSLTRLANLELVKVTGIGREAFKSTRSAMTTTTRRYEWNTTTRLKCSL